MREETLCKRTERTQKKKHFILFLNYVQTEKLLTMSSMQVVLSTTKPEEYFCNSVKVLSICMIKVLHIAILSSKILLWTKNAFLKSLILGFQSHSVTKNIKCWELKHLEQKAIKLLSFLVTKLMKDHLLMCSQWVSASSCWLNTLSPLSSLMIFGTDVF